MSDDDNGCVLPIPTGSIDAMAWAEAFVEYKRVYEWSVDDIDAELMVGWFANYWATVSDPLTRRIDELVKTIAESIHADELQREITALQAKIDDLKTENIRLIGDTVRCPSCGELYVLDNGRE